MIGSRCIAGNREHAVSGLEELRVHKRGQDGVPGLGIETEQATGLGRREPETGHLKVFRTDSAQLFCKRYTFEQRRAATKGLPSRKNLE